MSTKKIAWVAIASIFLVIIIAVISANPDAPLTLTDEEPVIEEPKYYLTLPADTLRFESHKIASGESFGALLGKRGISTAQIYKIAAAVEDEFNVRRIRAGVEVQFRNG